mgnify:CR=1 FL=1
MFEFVCVFLVGVFTFVVGAWIILGIYIIKDSMKEDENDLARILKYNEKK